MCSALLVSGCGVRGQQPLWRGSELPAVRSGGKVLYPLRNGAGSMSPAGTGAFLLTNWWVSWK